MKRTAWAICVLALFPWSSRTLSPREPGSPPSANEGPETGFAIVVDPRIELMNVVLTFTELPFYGKIPQTTYRYYQDVIDHFGPFRNHDAVKWCNTFPYFRDMSFPEQMMLYMSDPPTMTLQYEPPSHVPRELIDGAKHTADLLNRFAAESKFMDFWNAHRSYYDGLVAGLKRRLPYRDYLRAVERFYGVGSSRFVCVISPILYGAAFGPTLETGNTRVPYFVTGPDSLEQGKPRFSDVWLRLLIFHEYGHSFVNRLCEKHRDEIMAHASLLEKFNGHDVIKKIYNDWFVIVHEHIVRAGEYLLLKQVGLSEESEVNLRKNLKQGFALLPAFIEKLEYYASHRSAFPDFSSYFLEMLKVLDEAATL